MMMMVVMVMVLMMMMIVMIATIVATMAMTKMATKTFLVPSAFPATKTSSVEENNFPPAATAEINHLR